MPSGFTAPIATTYYNLSGVRTVLKGARIHIAGTQGTTPVATACIRAQQGAPCRGWLPPVDNIRSCSIRNYRDVTAIHVILKTPSLPSLSLLAIKLQELIRENSIQELSFAGCQRFATSQPDPNLHRRYSGGAHRTEPGNGTKWIRQATRVTEIRPTTVTLSPEHTDRSEFTHAHL